ncbi:site-specific DNA-methyltransferase [Campylobacter jejuni]|nr:site-specific DNA-methyltransferase [Campylobacter jejuni]
MERNESQSLQELKEEEKIKISDRANNGILEKENADFLIKLIDNAQNKTEVLKISALGMTYKRTGFHFDVRLEKNEGQTIRYLKKNENLSFDQGGITHKLIIGDNYPALLNLLINYKNKIKVIYIDPPYGKDNLGEFAQTNYNNAITRDNLLSMLYPRLILARQLLKDDGVIFCSIDDRNQAYVKCLFDEVFGEGNFVSTLIWRKIEENSSSGGTMKITKNFRKDHEFVICYAKNYDLFLTNKFLELPNFENKYKNLDNDPRGEFKAGSISMKGNKNSLKYYEIETPSGKKYSRVWRITKEEFQALDEDNRIYYGKNKDSVPQIKIFINEERPVTPTSFFENLGSSFSAGEYLNKIFKIDKGESIFSNPKPVDLIKRICETSINTNENDIILDFFAGSGTTGHAVLELNKQDGGNRQFILVTNNEITDLNPNGIALDVTSKRLKRIMSGECYDKSKDFKWLEKNTPYGDSLEVSEIQSIASSDHSVFEKIDEKLYGKDFENIHDKIEWICKEFELTCRKIEGE